MTSDRLDPRRITVTGEAQVIASPNQAVVAVGLETVNAKFPAAKAANDDLLHQVLGVAQRVGIESKHIQTDHISLHPNQDWRGNRQVIKDYSARRTLLLTLENLSTLERLLSDLLEAGVSHIHEVEFRTTSLKRYRDEARAHAIQAAQAKARALAGALGQGVGQPLVIQENKDEWQAWRALRWWGGGWAEPAMQTSLHRGPEALNSEDSPVPGQISIRASVTVTFELVELRSADSQ
jgi:uncharacterized protein YggE